MKPKITLLAFIISFSVNAQNINYLDNNPIWRQDWKFGAYMPCLEIHNYMYYLNGDTTIGNYNYKKIFDRHKIEYSWLGPPPSYMCEGSSFNDGLKILIRQENKKMYVNNQGDEFLLYDFDLAIGDTLPLTYNNMWDDSIIVTGVDSIKIRGNYRKIFTLSQGNIVPPGLLIEGVGFNSGLLEPFPNQEFPAELLCFTLSDTAYYPYNGYDCDLSVGLTSENASKIIKTFPNPVIDQLTIEPISSEIIDQIIISDMLGKKSQIGFKQFTGGIISVDFSIMRTGLYILQLQSRRAAPINIKVIKK